MPVREHKLSLDTAVLREALGLTEEQLPDDATDEQVQAALTGGSSDPGKAAKVPENDPENKPPENKPVEPGKAKEDKTPVEPRQVPGGLVVDADMWRQTQEELAVVRSEREQRERREDAEFIKGAVRSGKFPGARADHYMTLMQADRDGTRDFITRLPEGLPVTEMGNLGNLEDAMKASDYPEQWLNPAERRRIKSAAAAYAEGGIADVEPGSIIRES